MIKVQSLRNGLKEKVNYLVSSVGTTFKNLEKNSKGKFYENWVRFWKNVLVDYREVYIDLGKEIKGKPLKATGIGCFSAFVVCLFKCNPTEPDFRSAVVRAGNDIRQVPQHLQKKEAADHLRYLEECYNQNLIRRLNLGVISIIWVDKYSRDYNNVDAVNKYLQISTRDFFNNVLDVGILNIWFVLPRKMEDYDVNF